MTSFAPLDTTVVIPTPENIAFNFRIAGPFRRFPAFALDLVVRTAIVIGLLILVTPALGSEAGMGLIAVIFFAVDWFYGALLEGYWNGQTVGKRALRLRVVSTEGLPISPAQAILRNFLRVADYTPVFLLPAALAFFFTRRFQRLGDLVAATMVVLEESARVKLTTAVDDPQVRALANELPSRLTVDRGLALALIAYVDRRPSLSPPRRFEICGPLAHTIAAQMDLPREINPDLLLCALHQRLLT